MGEPPFRLLPGDILPSFLVRPRSLLSETLLEVRCCCDPGKLLGWLDAPRNLAPGSRVTFRLNEPLAVSAVTLRVGVYAAPLVSGGYEDRLAYESGDLPIEAFRRIDGFLEAPPVQS